MKSTLYTSTSGGAIRRTLGLVFLAALLLQQLNAQKKVERLGRGLVALRTSSSQVYVGWRLLGTDASGTGFNVYRGSTKLNASILTASTNYVDNYSGSASYSVRPVVNGQEQAGSPSVGITTTPYLNLPLQVPPSGTTPTGETYTYNANDCSVGDADGDGEYEVFLKWDPSNSKDNSQSGYTGNVYIDAYKLNGTRLWRIDLGRNIRAGAHYTQFMVYDLDGDGKAEMACKTAEGTKDGTGVVLGPNPNADYRTSSGYILSGPEFLTIFSGLTGKALATTDYLPGRGTVSSWGDNYGNRVDRFVAGVAYLDGTRPSLVMGRGYYTRLVRVAWDWRNGQLTQRWIFDSNNGYASYNGQGNHQLTVGDVDGDGKDEICNGSSAINDNGAGLYANGLGHGDALHMSNMDPDRSGQEVWQAHEDPGSYGNYGLEFRDAKTGQPLWGVAATGDVGRALAADVDPRYKGYECWGAAGGLYTCKGVQIASARPSMNFAVWWDADLVRELLDGNHIDKWNYSSSSLSRILTASECSSNNSTKATPCLSADILGDWREEVIWRTTDNTALHIYTTTITATNRLYTLMHDPQYRVAIAWQNTAYNQPPHPGFYLGTDMAAQPVPNIQPAGNAVALASSVLKTTAVPLRVYPNPSGQEFLVKRPGDFSYAVYDGTGRLLETGKASNEHRLGKLLQPGTYVIQVNGSNGRESVKVIKQ